MPLIVLSSPKGGVGKTTLTANLSAAMLQLGWRVAAVDFDVQNALRLHFGMPLDDGYGYVERDAQDGDWESLLLRAKNGAYVLPYGNASRTASESFDKRLQEKGGALLKERLGQLLEQPDFLVFADTRPGPSPALAALDDLADLRIALLLADASSLALMPRVEEGTFFRVDDTHTSPIYFIVNQIDPRKRLNRDVLQFISERAGPDVLGSIRQDEAVAEAIADQRIVVDHAPNSAASLDIHAIAKRLNDTLISGGIATMGAEARR